MPPAVESRFKQGCEIIFGGNRRARPTLCVDTAIHALREVGFEIYGGEVLVLIRPSGGGLPVLLDSVGKLDWLNLGSSSNCDVDFTVLTDARHTLPASEQWVS